MLINIKSSGVVSCLCVSAGKQSQGHAGVARTEEKKIIRPSHAQSINKVKALSTPYAHPVS
jgi:hypothetical protein